MAIQICKHSHLEQGCWMCRINCGQDDSFIANVQAIIARVQEIRSKYLWGSQQKLMQDLADDYKISLRQLKELAPVKITSSFDKASEHQAIIAKVQEIWSKYPQQSQQKLMQDLVDDYKISLSWL